ncbi:hypothetical protein EC973_005492 [Apophysomyces ossiformis]|uniref:WKF domain-containing protein n=1 Tax=Apophysomyces ossiformis TaxID=679940 RepID=A0A8H7EK45_9FUNG|nr:hypothetical protein EC973_005492 [Apophysomyces ossiformis]
MSEKPSHSAQKKTSSAKKSQRLTPAQALLQSLTAKKAAQQVKGKGQHVTFDDEGNQTTAAPTSKTEDKKVKNSQKTGKKRKSDNEDLNKDKKAKTESTSEETKKTKKTSTPKKKKQTTPEESIPIVKAKDKTKEGLDYLRLFVSDRTAWKFRKAQQIWLLQHIYDQDKIKESDFKILLEYLKDMQGSAREKTLKEAQAICETSSKQLTSYGGVDDDDDDFDAEKMLARASKPVVAAPSSSVETEDAKTERAKAIVNILA